MTRRNKYGNKKCEYLGIKFDSAKEMRRYQCLKILLDDGHIFDLVVHPRFKFDGAIIKSEKRKSTPTYEADFSYTSALGKKIVEDCKSSFTASLYEFKFKRAIFERDFKQEITVII